ncbi:MAG: exodeoxyribonuclease VII small subunit [Pseudohongiella sp.]|nr:exodeoxyribonuclease VII small subunit [Pseudohongiella sp.]MDP2285735.1 exodeoxyribonuclease VII small subunit [Pseudohongiella sp.]
MSDNNQAPAFEETLAQLETLVSRMEDGQMSLEDALSAFETGIKLTRDCQQALQQAELKVQMLTRADGNPEAFDLTSAGLGANSASAISASGD